MDSVRKLNTIRFFPSFIPVDGTLWRAETMFLFAQLGSHEPKVGSEQLSDWSRHYVTG
jgi:hypothetical protein